MFRASKIFRVQELVELGLLPVGMKGFCSQSLQATKEAGIRRGYVEPLPTVLGIGKNVQTLLHCLRILALRGEEEEDPNSVIRTCNCFD